MFDKENLREDFFRRRQAPPARCTASRRGLRLPRGIDQGRGYLKGKFIADRIDKRYYTPP